MRKEFKAIIAAILAVWLFMMGYEIGGYMEKQKLQQEMNALSAAQQTLPAETPTADTATQPAAQAPTAGAEDETPLTGIGNAIDVITTYPDSELSAATTAKGKEPTTEKQTQTTAPDVAALSKTQILQRVTTAVNDLKATQNMTARKEETVDVKIVDCSAPSAINLLNNIISKKTGAKTATYVFVNGKATGYDDSGKAVKDEGEVTPNQILPPTDAAFTLPETGVSSAAAKQSGSDIVYTLHLAEETSTLQSPVPTYHSQAIGYLKLSDLEVPGATITDAKMHYPGSTLTLVTDAQGKVKELRLHLPMDGSGSAKMGFLSGTAAFEGKSEQNWTFSY